MRLKVSSAKWRPFCLGLNVLINGIVLESGYTFRWMICQLNVEDSVNHNTENLRQVVHHAHIFDKPVICKSAFYMIFSCEQAVLRTLFPSVRPSVRVSVRPSACHTFFTITPSSYHHEIFRSHYQGQKWCPCKRSRPKVKGQGQRGQTPIQPFPDCNSSWNLNMAMTWCIELNEAKQMCPIVFKVTWQISRSRGLKKSSILTKIARQIVKF